MKSYEGELNDNQKFEMLRVVFSDDRWPVTLRHTPEIEAAYRRWLATDCQHDEEPRLRKKAIKGGGAQFVRVCSGCGYQYGGPVAKKDVPSPESVPPLDGLSQEEFYRRRQDIWRDEKMRFWAKQDVKISEEYEAYLKSAIWKSKRERVLARASNICEGCRVATASQVHHLSYEHRFNEFL